MDANLWKQLVEKVIFRTKSRDLLWSKTSEGPAKTLSFGTSIDDSTSLNIWGYEANYSYELCLIKQTGAEPFEERKRVTVKKNAEGIDFSGLFETVQTQMKEIPRERAFASLMEYLGDPTVEDQEKQQEFLDHWSIWSTGTSRRYGIFRYFQSERIIAAVKDMSVAGSITWTVGDAKDFNEEGQYYYAEVGDLISLTFRTPDMTPGATEYQLLINPGTGPATDDCDFYFELTIDRDRREHLQPLRLVTLDLETIVSKHLKEDKEKFNQIVRDDIFYDILASLDNPRKDSSSVGGT